MTAPRVAPRQEQVSVVRGAPVRQQSNPAANTDTTLYTVPKGKKAKGWVSVAEIGGAAATYRIALRKSGAAISNAHYLAFDRTIDANTSHLIPDLRLDVDDVLTVRASTTNVAFNYNGDEDPRS